MEYYDYMEFYNSPLSVISPEEDYLEWAIENCPDPTIDDIAYEYEQLKQGGF